MRDRYMRSSQGFAIVYSINSRASFEEVEMFVDQIYRIKDQNDGDVPMILVANKMDLEGERQVSSSAGREYAAKRKLLYIETSAKTGTNVETLFLDLAKRVLSDLSTSGTPKYKKRQKSKRGLFSSKTQVPETMGADALKVPTTRLYGHDQLHKVPPIVIPESTYSQDMKNLKTEMEFADVFFKTTDHPDLIPAHKFILISRCAKMRNLIEEHDKIAEKQSGIQVPCTLSTFQLFLDFAYTNSINFSNLNSELLDLATKWEMTDLVNLVAQQHPELVPANVIPAAADIHAVPKYKRDLRRSLIASGSDYKSFDVKFIIKDEPGKNIFAHKAILAQRSPYFRAMFTGGTKEKTAYEIEMSDFAHLPLLTAIEYCYTDDVRYMDDIIAVDLLITANKLCLGRLKLKVSEYIATGMHWDNLIKMFRLATVADAEALREFCGFFICRTFDSLAKTHSDFSMLTQEEKEFFRECRRDWVDINGLELYWQKKLMDKEEEQEKNDKLPPPKDKGCGIM
eukprot:Phypoly_transcript_06825.p1 GENE.Phypoly_transcript_06825~~Phypoly_transcript_06825.p1  ORF type:complete len:567 (+),score=87.26 Phypoly_transcript_06825:171-1703(+)